MKRTFAFVCSDQSDCPCTPGKLVQRNTAMRHWGQSKRRNPGNSISPPTAIPHEDVHDPSSGSEAVAPSKTAIRHSRQSKLRESSNFIPPPTSMPNEGSGDPSSVTVAASQATDNLVLISCSSSDSIQFEEHEQDTERSEWDRISPAVDESDFDGQDDHPDQYIVGESGNDNFKLFMLEHAKLVGLQARHAGVTEALMENLLEDANCRYYKSWKGVKGALLDNSGLMHSEHPFCSGGHRALSRLDDGRIEQCDHQGCQHPSKTYTYIHLWERLELWLQDSSKGPLLFEEYRRGLQQEFGSSGTGKRYVDFYSGKLFKEAVADLGGITEVQNDIFLSVSTDDVQAFSSSSYSYWPVVITVLNLPPSRRFKVENMLPVAIIPGPKAPVDLLSFLDPLFAELEELRRGKRVRLWNGSSVRVRVHLFFTQADLPAMAKLTNLSGHNGYCPCRFCKIHGVRVHQANHYYFPAAVTEISGSGRGEREVTKYIYYPRRLPLRDEIEFKEGLDDVEDARMQQDFKSAEDLRKKLGVKSSTLTPLVDRFPFMHAFRSFPIDIMHLLYQNIAKHIVTIWTGGVSGLDELAVLRDKEVLSLVNQSLESIGTATAAHVRKPRGIDKKGLWKAAEWKYFVHAISIVVLHDVVPKNLLHGWWLFVQLCELVNRWELREEDICLIRTLSHRFFEHFMEHYYKKDQTRISLCKYVYHCILHLEENIRDCGPLSLLAQWSMESYIGDLNRRCSAKSLYAESVSENVKFQAASRMYSLREGIHIHRLDPEQGYATINNSLCATSNMEQFQGHTFRHPKEDWSLDRAREELNFDVRSSMIECYCREFGFKWEDAVSGVDENPKIVVWSRLFHENAANQIPTMYRSSSSLSSENSRHSHYIAGVFEGSTGFLDVYYGRALAFVEHRVADDVFMLALCDWIQSGLKSGPQRQVFARGRLTSSLFTGKRVESVHSISHQITVAETKRRVSGRLIARTYFIDDLRELRRSHSQSVSRALSGGLHEEENTVQKFRLKGISG